MGGAFAGVKLTVGRSEHMQLLLCWNMLGVSAGEYLGAGGRCQGLVRSQ